MKTEAMVILSCVIALHAQAGSATWSLDPGNDDWITAANWTPTTVPNGPADTAIFGISETTSVKIAAAIEVSQIVFEPGASAFNIKVANLAPCVVSGVGITNRSGLTQQLVTEPTDGFGNEWRFINGATAGSNVVYGNNKSGSITFYDNATAGSASFNNHGPLHITGGYGIYFYDSANAGTAAFTSFSEVYGSPAIVVFNDSSSAAAATFSNEGGTVPGETVFADHSTAADASFSNEGGDVFLGDSSTAASATFFNGNGGYISFSGDSTAANSTINNEGGFVEFGTGDGGDATICNTQLGATEFFGGNAGNCTLIAMDDIQNEFGSAIYFFAGDGGTARIELFGKGNLDISELSGTSVRTGSIEGDGDIFLGGNNLTVGSSNRSTAFSGILQDGGYAGDEPGGSLDKIGSGRLILFGANTYTGGTTVESGRLMVNNTTGSGTGTGTVFVTGGSFGGAGAVTGRVIVGTGSGPGAVLAPGESGVKPGTLTTQKRLILEADATYRVTFDSRIPDADKVTSRGVSIRNASIRFHGKSASVIPVGTVFVLLDNTAATPIAGTFRNLPDGSTTNIGASTFQVDYEGGDGNDLTLTVVP